MTDARDRLLRDVMDHVARHGLADTSLRDLAAAVGTSHRMLHYHFGGRDGLVAAIVGAVEADQRQTLGAIAEGATTATEAVTAHWHVLTQPDVLPFVRLFFEVLALATHGRPGTEGFLDQLVDPWLEAGRGAADQLDAPVDDIDLRLGIAVTRGLLIDVLATGDLDAARQALDRFLTRQAGAGGPTAEARD